MEVLGVTASIISITQLTGTVTKLCHEDLEQSTGATKEMSLILNELYALKGVLEWLEVKSGNKHHSAAQLVDGEDKGRSYSR